MRKKARKNQLPLGHGKKWAACPVKLRDPNPKPPKSKIAKKKK